MTNKLLINDTVRIAASHSDAWHSWMKQVVFPLALKSGTIESYQLTKITGDEADDGISFACQYICLNSDRYSDFINNFDPKIQQEQTNRFGGYFGSFRSVLEILEEGSI
jgi:hypothetical protein